MTSIGISSANYVRRQLVVLDEHDAILGCFENVVRTATVDAEWYLTCGLKPNDDLPTDKQFCPGYKRKDVYKISVGVEGAKSTG